MAEEASKLRGLEARVAALETKFNFLLQFIRRLTEREEEKKKATISKRQKEIYPALSLSKAAQTLPTPRRPAFHIPRPSRTEPRQFQPLANPSPTTVYLAGQEEDDYACQPEDAYRTTTQRLQQRPDLSEGYSLHQGHQKSRTEAGTCQYHPGARDHNLQGCEEFKKEVASLITKGLIRRRGEQPERDCMTIDQLRLSPYEKTNFQARMERIKEDFEEFCEKKKEELGKLTPATPLEMSKPDPVVIHYATKEKVMLQTASVSAVQSSEKVPSVVIQVPQPFPYQDSKRIPWNYGMKVISTRESKPKTEEEVVGNLTSGLGGITRSGRCYTPEELEKRRKEAGKAVEDPTKTKAAEEEAADFLRIIKSSEYSIVKQLSKMPSHISVLSLTTRIRIPQESPAEITNQLTFSDDELPPEGRGHTKALYISVKTNDRIVSRVLIDNGSALNVCPLSTLEKLDIDPTRVRVNSMIVRAFDGTRREGDHGCIRPEQYLPPYIQKMKLIIGNQLVTILAEEPISIYNDGEIPYIDGCASEEASFHSFEFVTVIHRVAAVEPKVIQSWDHGSQGIRQGGISARARIRQMAYEARRQRAAAKLRGEKWPERKMVIPHIRTTFPASAMFQVDEGDVDELALLFTEDLNVNAITTEGDSAAFPIHADQHEEIDLEDFLDEENLKGYRIEEETLDEDTWEDDDLPDLLPHLMVPHGLETLEFEIFCEHGDPESHLRKYREKMALHTNNEFLMISTFHESLPECAVTWFYQLKNITCWRDLARAFLDRYQCNRKAATPPAKDPDSITITKEGEEPLKAPPPSNIITTTSAEEEYAGPMVEGLSIHTIAGEEDSTTTPPTRHCQQGEEAKTWTCVPLLQRVSSSNEITRKTSNDPHRQDEGSKPNIEELETVNLADEGEEPREVKIGTRCATEQKEALIALLREFHEIFAWSYQDMPGLDTDIVVHKIPFEARMQAREASTAPNEARSHFEDQGGSGKAIEGRIPEHSNLFGLGSQYSPSPEKGWKTTNAVFSFMDGFSGYNQIKMAEEDKSKTAFVTHWGTFVYDVMPFGLKNAGATYQRAMVTLFHDMIHHEIEVYVDDMIAKSRTAQDHLTDLRKLFQRLKKYQLRLKPEQVCLWRHIRKVIRASSSAAEGIEIDPAKLASLHSLLRPASLCSSCLRKDVKIKWTEDCQRAFDKIKEYLLNPPILVPPTPGRPLILYLTVQEASMGCMLGQQDETGKKEQAIYYLSKKFTEPETRYLLVEKTCCALAWASKKLRQYMLYYTTWLVSRMDPIKYIFEKPALTGKIARLPVRAVRAEWTSEFPDEDVMTVDEDNHGRWKLYFDGAANAVGSGIGAVLVSPKGQQTPIAVKLGFDCTNNMTELTENGKLGIPSSSRIQRYISRLVPKFKYITFTYTPRAHNHFADALATLASLIKLVEGDDVRPLRNRDSRHSRHTTESIHHGRPKMRRNTSEGWPSSSFLSGEILYKRTHDATLLRCVDAEEANRLIQEMHAGLMGAHANGPFLARKIMRAGYYWLTMERDCIRHVQTCHKCQMYQNSKNAPPQYLHTMASPWPFSAWGMDVIGAITPKASNGHEFILVAIDYFTKWVEACSFKNVTQVAVTRLCQQFKIQHHNSAPYRPKMNGAVEAANKNVKKILSKMTETYKDWHEHLPYALCAYRTSVRTSVGATPYSLVYGMEAVLPVEVEIPSLRILSQTQLEEAEWAQARYEQLNFIDEKRLAALCHGQLYQRRIERAYNKKARPRTFQPGDLVLKKRNMALSDPRGKFAPSYEGPYVVKKAFSGGAIILADMDGEEFRSPINSDSVIKYHV
uniref:Integrase catalytic domain-containing protein n=1 Tax=Fagus sylvatica TaxID=28930 RepID=A0A2N9GM44_FAGSY